MRKAWWLIGRIQMINQNGKSIGHKIGFRSFWHKKTTTLVAAFLLGLKSRLDPIVGEIGFRVGFA